MGTDVLGSVLLLLGVTVCAVWLVRRLHLPGVIGYLLTGLVLGPHLLDWVPDTPGTQALGEFGIVFLLFMIGLEFSFPRLVAMRHEVFVLGGIQVAFTLVAAAAALHLAAGLGMPVAILLGGAVAMSSTALVAKQLGEQLELRQTHGRLAIGVLLFQDLAVIPLLILIPVLSGAARAPWLALGIVFAKGLATIALMALAARFIVRPVLHEISRARSGELFLLASLLVVLAAAWATHATGLSLALGAFIAGAVLAESEYRHQIEADIRPFRDILLGLFFVTVGMYANPRLYAHEAGFIVGGTAALILFKTLIVVGVGRLLKVGVGDALRTGLVLGQGGEFGLALIALALGRGYVPQDMAQLALNILILSMLVSPLLVRYNAEIAARFAGRRAARADESGVTALAGHEHDLAGHVILAGYGRVGQNLARLLEEEGIPFLALDLDPRRVREAHAGGDPVYLGDATRAEVLEASGLARARALVVSYQDVNAAMSIVEAVRRVRRDLPVLVRTRDDTRLEELRRAGADEVIPETLEASLMIAAHVLAVLGVPMRRVLRRITEVRSHRYALMRNVYRRGGAEPLDPAHAFREQLDAVTLGGQARAIGRSLAELELESLEVAVQALRREGIVGREPGPETILRDGDTLVLYGTPENLKLAQDRLLGG